MAETQIKNTDFYFDSQSVTFPTLVRAIKSDLYIMAVVLLVLVFFLKCEHGECDAVWRKIGNVSIKSERERVCENWFLLVHQSYASELLVDQNSNSSPLICVPGQGDFDYLLDGRK